MKTLVTALTLFLSLSATAAEVYMQDLIENADVTNEKVDGLRDFRVVIPGILYRGGNSGGGHQPLRANGLQSLCDRGFSQAVYMYPDNFEYAPKPSCDLEYTTFGGGIKDRKLVYNYLKKVKAVIDGTKQGPLYIHCWNGWHASGEMAAYALMQFCGMNGQQAQAYWNANVNVGKGTVTRMQRFQTFNDLNISAEQQAQICPK